MNPLTHWILINLLWGRFLEPRLGLQTVSALRVWRLLPASSVEQWNIVYVSQRYLRMAAAALQHESLVWIFVSNGCDSSVPSRFTVFFSFYYWSGSPFLMIKTHFHLFL